MSIEIESQNSAYTDVIHNIYTCIHVMSTLGTNKNSI